MHCRRSQAPANSAAARRCMQRTAEVQRRQLRHPHETRCQRRCPSCFDPIVCTHRRPSARPSQAPPPPTAPRPTTLSPQHAASSQPYCRPSQAPANSASCRRWHTAYRRGSASSAAPSFRDSVPATLPQLLRTDCLHATAAPRKPHHPLHPCAHNRPSPQHTTSSVHSRRLQTPAQTPAAADVT
jgi:hypothetical protein